MTNEEAFKIGFLMRCAEEGLPAEQIAVRVKHASLNRQARGELRKVAGSKSLFTSLLTNMIGLAKLGLIAGPPILGAAGGAALATAHQDDFDPQEAKKQELIAEYQRALGQFNQSQRVQELA